MKKFQHGFEGNFLISRSAQLYCQNVFRLYERKSTKAKIAQ